MSNLTIPDAFRQQFADSFRETVRQTNSRLRKTVRTESGLSGISKQVEFVLPTTSEETTGQRFKKVILKELETDQRWYYPREFQTPTGVSKWDEKSLAPTIMPGGTQIRAHEQAFNIDCDNVILNALTGAAYTGKTGGTTVNLADVAAQYVQIDWVASGSTADSGLNPAKLIRGLQILKGNEAWNDEARARGEQLYCVIDAMEEARMRHAANTYNGDRLFSTDYGPPVFDEQGFLMRWMGINFVMYNSLLTETVSNGKAGTSITAKIVPLYVGSAVEFGIWGDFSTSVDLRPDLSNAVQFLSQYSIGAGREQEKKVVRIDCLTTLGADS
jgi:hypothetical protein